MRPGGATSSGAAETFGAPVRWRREMMELYTGYLIQAVIVDQEVLQMVVVMEVPTLVVMGEIMEQEEEKAEMDIQIYDAHLKDHQASEEMMMPKEKQPVTTTLNFLHVPNHAMRFQVVMNYFDKKTSESKSTTTAAGLGSIGLAVVDMEERQEEDTMGTGNNHKSRDSNMGITEDRVAMDLGTEISGEEFTRHLSQVPPAGGQR